MSFSVLENFNVEVPAGSKVILKLTTNLGAPVPVEDFVSIVQTFHKGNFVLNVDYESTVACSNLKFVTPLVIFSISAIKKNNELQIQMLRSYFFDKSVEHFLTKNKVLTKEQRNSIVNTIVDFILEVFGNEPTHTQKALTAQAAIIEFPGLEFNGGDATVSILKENHFKCKVELSTKHIFVCRNYYWVKMAG